MMSHTHDMLGVEDCNLAINCYVGSRQRRKHGVVPSNPCRFLACENRCFLRVTTLLVRRNESIKNNFFFGVCYTSYIIIT
jgi:hypothetical protein